jgi:hypothetical protein
MLSTTSKPAETRITVYNRVWFWFLNAVGKDSLYFYDKFDKENQFVVAWQYQKKDVETDEGTKEKINYLFTNFDSPDEFFEFTKDVNQHKMNFYEVIAGSKIQRLHFDVDISDKELFPLADEFIHHIVDKLKQKSIDVDIYTSHSFYKYSYHIVGKNDCHNNNVEAKAFYNKIRDELTEENKYPLKLIECIDHQVYTSNQQFRMFGSSKIDTSRVKIRQDGTPLNKETFLQSLVSVPPQTFKIIPIEGMKQQPTFNYVGYWSQTNLDKSLKMIGVPEIFSIENTTDNGRFIKLKRNKPSPCRLCLRTHDHDGGYVNMKKIKGGATHWVFTCFRQQDQQKYRELLPVK